MSMPNAAKPVIVSRYFSRKIAQMTTRKYELKSVSFSAIGVTVSPGRRVIAAEAVVEAAVSFITVDFFLLRDSMIPA